MAVEIEKKYLLKGDAWRNLAEGVVYRQGYLNRNRERTVRVRIAGGKGYLTVKGAAAGGKHREYEYAIPLEDAAAMLEGLCEQPLIEKRRYRIPVDGLVWEVDEFYGANRGLILAEVELHGEEQAFSKPDWVGEEVTGDPKYFNSSLIANPFSSW